MKAATPSPNPRRHRESRPPGSRPIAGFAIPAMLGLCLAIASCSRPAVTKSPGSPEGADAPEPEDQGEIVAVEDGFLLSRPPDGAVGIVAAREDAAPGNPIVLRGKVGGRVDPFVENRALLVLADEDAIRSCDEIPGDSCETPWDYCCEDPDQIRRSTATIQIVDADGRVAEGGFKGLGGMRELSVLVVQGTVDESSSPGALIVNAEHVFVEEP